MLDFSVAAEEERSMGPETTYTAVLHHPQLGPLVWSIWEYPVGVENYRETDVGPHKLLEDIDFGLGVEPPEPDQNNFGDDSEQDEDRQARIDALVGWFFERYEDPANRLPYASAEGGYQWIYGGPYDAREQLGDNFPDEPDDIVEAAVDEIESEGLTDWAPASSADDYDQYVEEPPDEFGPRDARRELAAQIEGLPMPVGGPAFRAGDDGLIHMAIPLDAATPDAKDPLLSELRLATSDLLGALAGTNAHTDLQIAAQRYNDAINGEKVSISQVYARGVRLANAAEATRLAVEMDDLPSLPHHTDAHLPSVLDLNRAYIMAHPEGRKLAEGAAAYQRGPSDIDPMRNAARDFAVAVETAPNLFGEDVRRHTAEAAADVGQGPQPERSNQAAASTFSNLTISLLRIAASGTRLVGGAVISGAIAGSIPGGALASEGAQLIDIVWSFLITNASTFRAVAGAFGTDLSWMTPVSDVLGRLKRHPPQQ